MVASRNTAAVRGSPTGRPTPWGTLCPPPTRPRESPVVGRNQCSLMLIVYSFSLVLAVEDRLVEAVGEERLDVELLGQQPGVDEGVGHLLLGGEDLVVEGDGRGDPSVHGAAGHLDGQPGLLGPHLRPLSRWVLLHTLASASRPT